MKSLCLVKDDKLDVGYIADQAMFKPANDPGQFGIWPDLLQGADYRQSMTDIAHGGESQDAERSGW